MECTRWIPKLQVIIDDYILEDSFLVVNMDNIDIVFGVQWFYSIGEHNMNYKAPVMKFDFFFGKQVVLEGFNNYPIQKVASYILRVEYKQNSKLHMLGKIVDI